MTIYIVIAVLIIVIVLYAVLVNAVGKYAEQLNRDKGEWTMIAYVVSPMTAFMILYILGKKK
jgi:hypothetical protein